MTLETYIKDLLYRYDCVVVPNFGAFICNEKSATINGNSFHPPYKQIIFNSLIQNNDGLLATHIATTDKMPYKTAINFITFEVETWIEKLMDDELELSNIGTFTMINDTILFEESNTENFLTSAFGLSSYSANKTQRGDITVFETNTKESSATSIESNQSKEVFEAPIIKINQKKPYSFLKYAAVVLLLLSFIGLVGKQLYTDSLEKNNIAIIKKQQELQELSIQTATFVIKNPLPVITLSNNTTKITKDKYYIIAGAFRNVKNANKKVSQLKQKGFNAFIIGKNKWNLAQVAFAGFSSLNKANVTLSQIQKSTAKDAWLLIAK